MRPHGCQQPPRGYLYSMLQFIPDPERLRTIFGLATAPAFFLGAIAGFVSLMSTRLAAALERLQASKTMSSEDQQRRERHVTNLRRRVRLLQQAIRVSLVAGVTATVLLADLFATEFFGIERAYGAGLLFGISTVCLGIGLLRFAQEAWIGSSEMDE
jgi:hypothetical protein